LGSRDFQPFCQIHAVVLASFSYGPPPNPALEEVLLWDIEGGEELGRDGMHKDMFS
jgi:hypothetical protein